MFNREFACEPWECHFSYKTDKQTKKIVQSNFKWAFSLSFMKLKYGEIREAWVQIQQKVSNEQQWQNPHLYLERKSPSTIFKDLKVSSHLGKVEGGQCHFYECFMENASYVELSPLSSFPLRTFQIFPLFEFFSNTRQYFHNGSFAFNPAGYKFKTKQNRKNE